MKSDPECLVCMFRQALNTAKVATDNEIFHKEVIDRLAARLHESDLTLPPAHNSKKVYDIVTEVTGNKDPYVLQKKATNREALDLLPDLIQWIKEAEDPLDAALHLSVAGNIIDMGIGHQYELKRDVRLIMERPFAIDDTDDFRRLLRAGRRLLFLGDNAGEIVFDRVLVQVLLTYGIKIIYAVKSGPIINDALMEDARIAGLTNLVEVIETGSNDIGVHFNRAGKDFLRTFEAADIILAKGHGNFETCSGLPHNIFFLLKAKCEVVARELGIRLGDIVLKH